jgi:ATPase subunit of ABC transporter with duplicated ATPase domains
LSEKKHIKRFIKNYDLIREEDHTKDLLDFSKTIKIFSKKLDSIKESSIVGLIGKYGSGKSTMLHQIKNKRQKQEL